MGLDERWAKLEEREKAERPWGQDDPLINALGRLRYFYRGLRRHLNKDPPQGANSKK